MKTCTKCGRLLPVSDFALRNNRTSGLASRCKDCQSDLSAQYYIRNKEAKNIASSLRYAELKESDPRISLLAGAKRRTRDRGSPECTLELDDISIPSICPILGLTLEVNKGLGATDCSPSLDRIIPTLGYVKGNVRVVSYRANRLRSDATVDELSRLLADATKLLKEENHGS